MKTAFIVFYFCLLGFVALYGIHLYYLIFLYVKNRHRRLEPFEGALGRSEFPMVTVQLPIFNEKMVAVRLIKAVVAFDWPKDKLEIQILDDSTDSTCDSISDYLHARKHDGILLNHLRRGERTGFKAGALEYGLKLAKGNFVAIFDADNLPAPDFLRKTIPYFNDDQAGLVQTRWGFLNRGESLLSRTQALQLDAHFIIEQQARFWGKLVFNFNGTGGVWRKQAIIDGGGWQHDTLTEDLDLSFRAQMAGWKFIYDNTHIVPTELPNNISGYKTQQYRWAKGAVQTFFKLAPRILKSNLETHVKIAAMFHLTNKFVSLALFILGILLIPALYFRMESGFVKLLFIDLPIFLAGSGSMSLFYSLAYKAERKEKKLSDLFTLPLLTSIGVALAVNNSRALISALMRRTSPFNRTPKSGSVDGGYKSTPVDYLTGVDRTTYFETALTFYSFLAITLAVYLQLYFAIPFLITFFVGYLYFSFKGWSEVIFNQRVASSR